MPMWGRSPDLLLCDQVLLSRRRCDIAFQARPPASHPVKGTGTSTLCAKPALVLSLPPNSRSTKMFIAHSIKLGKSCEISSASSPEFCDVSLKAKRYSAEIVGLSGSLFQLANA